MSDATSAVRLPIVGEAARPAGRGMVAAGQAEPVAAVVAEAPAALVVVHGVGECAPGDVVGEIAAVGPFARGGALARDTLYARATRYTLLNVRASGAVRMLEVNWSDVRRPMPNLLGLMRHFVILLVAMNRVGAGGAYRSTTLSQPLATGWLTLWAVEALLVWSAFAPAVSALLWQLEPGERLGAGVLVAGAALYTAWLLRTLSAPMAGGAVLFAIASAWWGWWTCFDAEGRQDATAAAAGLHTWATLIAASAVLASVCEILLRPLPAAARADGRVVHRLARIACLWLPLVLMVVMQPLSVSLLLLPMDEAARTQWGLAYSKEMPFDPHAGQTAAGWVAAALAGTLVLGALQYRAVQRLGRNATVLVCWSIGLALLLGARWLERYGFGSCDLCRACLRLDWMAVAGLMLSIGASVTWVLFSRTDVAQDPRGRAWMPAGAFARFWAGVMLAAVPLALVATLGWLWGEVAAHRSEEVLADAAEVFIESTKFALLLLPLATRPFAAFLDALGDVFFFVVPSAHLSTRRQTLPRLAQALRLLAPGGGHTVVFAHSQGTVIAATMLSRMARLLARSPGRLTLVTVGSPLTTLYRNFLGAHLGEGYAALCAAQPERFRWINLSRPADYIGGAIELPGVSNRDLLTPGDHAGYWSDTELLKWLKALCEGRAD